MTGGELKNLLLTNIKSQGMELLTSVQLLSTKQEKGYNRKARRSADKMMGLVWQHVADLDL